jgi:hypothetical protein
VTSSKVHQRRNHIYPRCRIPTLPNLCYKLKKFKSSKFEKLKSSNAQKFKSFKAQKLKISLLGDALRAFRRRGLRTGEYILLLGFFFSTISTKNLKSRQKKLSFEKILHPKKQLDT